ncbi:MAG TPA: GIY-YIG nuclease family protein [Patescibacteria group bacterium]|nr:GIY-YIG nuclease family protein [Patescibacteria group bacterium]
MVRSHHRPPFDKLMAFSQEIEECPEFIEGQFMKYFTYILLCENNKYYVGHTNNLENRFEYHLKKSGAKFTSQNKPKKFVWSQEFSKEIDAIRREKQIKGWSRVKKDKLISGI